MAGHSQEHHASDELWTGAAEPGFQPFLSVILLLCSLLMMIAFSEERKGRGNGEDHGRDGQFVYS